MSVNKMTFTKILLSIDSFYHFKNILKYEISSGTSGRKELEIRSTLLAEIRIDSIKFSIKPIKRFFTVKGFQIFSEEKVIGEIDYWGWSWSTPRITLFRDKGNEVWLFDRNKPGLFSKRGHSYSTKLKSNNNEISFYVELGDYLISTTRNDCLRQVKGSISFDHVDNLLCILGIYMNELMIFDEMNK